MIPLPTVDVLDSITIPTHCPVSWDEMQGDDRTRHCTKCNESVHDVSELTTAEAVALLSGPGKRPCLRIYRRQDGRVMTADCPANRRERLWRWLRRRSPWAASLFALVFLSGCRTAWQGMDPTSYHDAVMNTPPGVPKTAEPPTPTPP